jgi:AAA+ superfamily predicted ATPase
MPINVATCNKCGEHKELVFPGSVCGDCSEALDKRWAGCTATDWLLTRPWIDPDDQRPSVSEFVYLDTTYVQVKRYWASVETVIPGFFRLRRPGAEESARPPSHWGTHSNPSRGSIIRPATPEEIAVYRQSNRDWSITLETERIIGDTCEKMGISEHADPQSVEQAAETIAGRLQGLGWLDELVKMDLEDSNALQVIDNRRLLEIVLHKGTEGLALTVRSASRIAKQQPNSGRGLSQVAGMSALKEQLMHEIIGPFKDPELYRRYRVTLPNGILFYGPPGCGKTYIARTLADELGWHFQYCRPSDVASPYIHDTVSRIRAVFSTAIEKAPSIIFIDEFEAFVPARSGLGGHQQYKAEEVNEFLANLEGCAERRVLVIAATNEPERIDPAVRRSGRFDKLILIPPPDADARRAMLEFHLADRPVDGSLNIAGIAAVLEGYSASDIKLLVDEAARMALKRADLITTSTLLATLERVAASITAEDMQRYDAFRSRGTG